MLALAAATSHSEALGGAAIAFTVLQPLLILLAQVWSAFAFHRWRGGSALWPACRWAGRTVLRFPMLALSATGLSFAFAYVGLGFIGLALAVIVTLQAAENGMVDG